MIKKILGSLIIIGLTITGFSNAYTQTVGLNSYPSHNNNDYEITALTKGRFITNYLGIGKGILALNNSVLFFRHTSGYPYFYGGNSNQGFFKYYYLCDLINSGSTSISNCTAYELNEDSITAVNNFLNSVGNGETFYYLYNAASGQTPQTFRACWSSSTYNKTLCFRKENSQALTGSYNYDTINFSNIPASIYQNGPNVGGGGDNLTGEITIDGTMIYNGPCPTIKQVMDSYGTNYNTGLCYNNTKYFNGTTFETITKDDIFTIFGDYENYKNRISIYWNNCTNANTTQACQNAFSGEFKKYSIISNAINSNVDEKRLWNYCNMGLNYDLNATTCVAATGVEEEYTAEEKIESVIKETGIAIPKPQTNRGTGQTGNANVLNSLNACEDGDRSCYLNNRDFINSLGNIYGKLTGLFKQRSGVNGIIPDYIMWLCFVTILFTILFKK